LKRGGKEKKEKSPCGGCWKRGRRAAGFGGWGKGGKCGANRNRGKEREREEGGKNKKKKREKRGFKKKKTNVGRVVGNISWGKGELFHPSLGTWWGPNGGKGGLGQKKLGGGAAPKGRGNFHTQIKIV